MSCRNNKFFSPPPLHWRARGPRRLRHRVAPAGQRGDQGPDPQGRSTCSSPFLRRQVHARRPTHLVAWATDGPFPAV